tara:strand:+ start:1566 stop:2618 length:1053 start_codon:yes stop_codon:yes gene_type:complete
MASIAIVNSFDYHWECLGFLLHWICHNHKELDIYVYASHKSVYEWIQVYDMIFDKLKVRVEILPTLNESICNMHESIIVLSGDDPFLKSCDHNGISVIIHALEPIFDISNHAKKINYAPFEGSRRPFVIGAFVPNTFDIAESKSTISYNILFSGTLERNSTDWVAISRFHEYVKTNVSVSVTYINRKLDRYILDLFMDIGERFNYIENALPLDLFKHVANCDAVISFKTDKFSKSCLSGIVPLAISFLKPMLLHTDVCTFVKGFGVCIPYDDVERAVALAKNTGFRDLVASRTRAIEYTANVLCAQNFRFTRSYAIRSYNNHNGIFTCVSMISIILLFIIPMVRYKTRVL